MVASSLAFSLPGCLSLNAPFFVCLPLGLPLSLAVYVYLAVFPCPTSFLGYFSHWLPPCSPLSLPTCLASSLPLLSLVVFHVGSLSFPPCCLLNLVVCFLLVSCSFASSFIRCFPPVLLPSLAPHPAPSRRAWLG